MNKTANFKLLIAGMLLAFLGLVLGAIIPIFTNPRLALSAHEQGIIAGGFLILLGLVWPYAKFSVQRSTLTCAFLIAGAYLIWLGIFLGSILGTSRATPIAGAGFTGTTGQEITVSTVLMSGSFLLIFGMVLLLVALISGKKQEEN